MPASSSSASPTAIPEDVQFALEALHNLVTFCPDWAKRLDELSGQIDRRQVDLAQLAEQQSPDARARPRKKPLRNRGSTESLKPKDDGEAHPCADGRIPPDEADAVQNGDKDRRVSVVTDGLPAQTEPSSSNNEANSPTSSAVERQTPQVMAAASANARATLRRAQLTKKRTAPADSLLTGDGAVATKYRSRCLVIVYYDSYVQCFFEEVVKFVSASRNLMRKAKMAAKVAQIKRMAELEIPDDESDSDDGFGFGNGTAKFVPPQLSPSALQPDVAVDGPAQTNGDRVSREVGETKGFDLPTTDLKPEHSGQNGKLTATSPTRLSYTRSNGNVNDIGKDLSLPSPKVASPLRPSMAWSPSFSTYGGGIDPHQPPDVFDQLDKGLEFVQSMCEHAAHQFLRDGDCADEIVKIKEKLTETKGSADQELQRRLDNDEDGRLRKMLADGPARTRTYRPQSMRRDAASIGGGAARLKTSFAGGLTSGTNGAAATGPDEKAMPLETGAMMLEVDEGIADADKDKEPPKFQYRSTRAMGARAATSS